MTISTFSGEPADVTMLRFDGLGGERISINGDHYSLGAAAAIAQARTPWGVVHRHGGRHSEGTLHLGDGMK